MQKVQLNYLRRIMEIPRSTPIHGTFLDLGILPIQSEIEQGQLCYLRQILVENVNDPVLKVYKKMFKYNTDRSCLFGGVDLWAFVMWGFSLERALRLLELLLSGLDFVLVSATVILGDVAFVWWGLCAMKGQLVCTFRRPVRAGVWVLPWGGFCIGDCGGGVA